MVEIIRGWCGEARPRRDELNALRSDLWRMNELMNRAVEYLLTNGDENRAWILHSEMYPESVRKGWKSQYRIKAEDDARWKALWEKEAELARDARNVRRIEFEGQAEREKARLLGYDPPPWATQ
jgi:hypothetical protein